VSRLLCQNLITQSKLTLACCSRVYEKQEQSSYFNLLQSLCFLATVGAIVSAVATKTV